MPCDQDGRRGMRSVNLYNALLESGHDVKIWTSDFYHQTKSFRSESVDLSALSSEDEIKLIKSCGYKKNISIRRVIDHFTLAINLFRELKREKRLPDVAFVGYPPIEFATVACYFLRAKKIPFIIDVKDQWPHKFLETVNQRYRYLTKLSLAPYFYLSRYAFKHAVGICSMSEDFLNWSLTYANRDKKKYDLIIPLSPVNERLSVTQHRDAGQWWGKKGVINDGRLRVVFFGTLSRAFDFLPLIHAAAEAKKSKQSWQFIICGDGECFASLQKETSHLDNILMTGWVDHEKISVLASVASLGCAPYISTEDFEASIPNKVIDYISYGLPVLTSLEGSVSKLLNKEGIGFFYRRSKLNDFYNQIADFERNPHKNLISGRARHVYNEVFDGRSNYKKLVKHLEVVFSEVQQN